MLSLCSNLHKHAFFSWNSMERKTQNGTCARECFAFGFNSCDSEYKLKIFEPIRK